MSPSTCSKSLESAKRTIAGVSGPRNEVERSGSRSSLRSSRSSLNSATSVNTVRNLGPAGNHAQLGRYTSAIRALTSDLRKGSTGSAASAASGGDDKRRGSTPRSSITKIPASRSSSSGSSVGARTLRKAMGVSTFIHDICTCQVLLVTFRKIPGQNW